MPTTGPFNSTALGIYIDGTLLAYSTSGDYNVNRAEIDVTSKDSGGWKDVLYGLGDWSISAEGIVALDSSTNAGYLFGLQTAKTTVNVKFSTDTSGDDYYHGSAIITNLTMSAPMEDKATFSCTLVGDGVPTESEKT
ncbi:MAG: phage tail tube protein [Nitrosomonadaceae bacterium]